MVKAVPFKRMGMSCVRWTDDGPMIDSDFACSRDDSSDVTCVRACVCACVHACACAAAKE